jgi:hypothetical protein
MKRQGSHIFRPEVLERYVSQSTDMVLHEGLSNPKVIYVWPLVYAMLAILVFMAFIRLPVIATGQVVVLNDSTDDSITESEIISFWGLEHRANLKAGQSLILTSLSNGESINATITKVESEPVSLQDAIKKSSVNIELTAPAVLAYLSVDLQSTTMFNPMTDPAPTSVEAKLGSFRLISKLNLFN